jgi:hypothetical protein
MPSLSAAAQNKVLDSLMRGVQLVTPPIWYVALVTTAGPTNAIAGLEVQGGSYARAAVPASLAAWAGTQGQGSTGISIGLGGNTSNNASILFPDPTSNWGAVVGYELWDAPVFGTRWIYDTLAVPKTISVGDSSEMFPSGALALAFV